MYNPLKPTLIGAVSGGLLGVVVPFYLGWEGSGYVADSLELGYVVNIGVQTVAGVGLSFLTRNKAIPVGVVVGTIVGGAMGISLGISGEISYGLYSQGKDGLKNRIRRGKGVEVVVDE